MTLPYKICTIHIGPEFTTIKQYKVMEDPHAPNPLVLSPKGEVPRIVINCLSKLFMHVGVSATFVIEVISKDGKVKTEYERGIQILNFVTGTKLRVFVQTSQKERYLCRISSPEMHSLHLHDRITAVLSGDFLIDKNNPVPAKQKLRMLRKKKTYTELTVIRQRLAEFLERVDASRAEEEKVLILLAKVRRGQVKLCMEINTYIKKYNP